MKIRNASGGSQAGAAITDWNNMTILNISYVGSGEETYVFNANSGATGWGGLASITSYSGCTIFRATAQVNTYYYSASSISARGVHCQEIGHTFGLDHSNDGGCMGGGYWYDIATHYTPVSHNVSDIGSYYANKSAGHSLVGPEAGEPRIHASWYNNPRSLREATRLASEVVVATADYVTAGDAIANAGEPSIPTQRVHFTVKRGQKGSLGAGESFVLFQNGNDENRFSEDPSYKIGHRYLLMLTPREDGSYLVVSPEGRYEVTGHGLVPAAEKGFALELKGASLPDVLSDVQRTIVDFPQQ
ncbi:MAG: hypothetical protein ABIS20_08115 [Thermoanaerobaculia bacterium]